MMNDFDAVLLKIGEFGRYQKIVAWLLCVPACFMNAYGGFGLVFQAYTPPFRCSQVEIKVNETRPTVIEECYYYNNTLNATERCDKFQFDDTYFDSTIITDYLLICDRAIHYKNVLSIFSGLGALGCFLFSVVQDQWGRKKAFFVCITMVITGNLASLFAPNLLWFTILRSPATLGGLASWNVGYIWALEYAGPSKRTMVTFVLSISYGVAAVSLGLIAWPCRTWVQLALATTVPFLLLYSYLFIIDESPRWLLSQGRTLEAEKVVLKIARGQNEPVTREEIHEMLETVQENERSEQMSSVKRIHLLFKGSNMRWKTLLITWIWFSVAVTYSGIAYNMENIGGNLYLNYILQAAVEIPATVLILVMLDRFGRVLSLAFAQIVCCSIFAFLSVPAEYLGVWAVIGCTIAVKFGSCLAFAIVCQFAGELYPTVIRGSGTGFSSSIGDTGNILMPYVIHSASAYKTLPLVILGLLSLITGIGSLFLPETSGQLLPETLEEAEERGSVGIESFKKNLSCCKKRISN